MLVIQSPHTWAFYSATTCLMSSQSLATLNRHTRIQVTGGLPPWLLSGRSFGGSWKGKGMMPECEHPGSNRVVVCLPTASGGRWDWNRYTLGISSQVANDRQTRRHSACPQVEYIDSPGAHNIVEPDHRPFLSDCQSYMPPCWWTTETNPGTFLSVYRLKGQFLRHNSLIRPKI